MTRAVQKLHSMVTIRLHGCWSSHLTASYLLPWAHMQDAVHWATTEEAALSEKAKEWLQNVQSKHTLSAVDGAREIGIGVGSEQVQA